MQYFMAYCKLSLALERRLSGCVEKLLLLRSTGQNTKVHEVRTDFPLPTFDVLSHHTFYASIHTCHEVLQGLDNIQHVAFIDTPVDKALVLLVGIFYISKE